MSAASHYYPDEPVASYFPEYESEPRDELRTNVAAPSTEALNTAPFTLSLLPCIKTETVVLELHQRPDLQLLSELEIPLQEAQEERFVAEAAIRLRIACKIIRRDWNEERIMRVRLHLGETGRAIRQLMSPDKRVRQPASQSGLFD